MPRVKSRMVSKHYATSHSYDMVLYREGGRYYAKDRNGNIVCKDSPTSCIQEAIDYISDTGGKIFIKRGVYLIDNTIKIGDKNKMTNFIHIEGEKPVLKPTRDIVVFKIERLTQSVIKDLYIRDEDDVTSDSTFAIDIDSTSYTTFENITINRYGKGILIKSTLDVNDTTRFNLFNKIHIMRTKHRGIEVWANVHDCWFRSISVEASGENGITFDHTLGQLPGIDISGGNQLSDIIILEAGGIGLHIVDWYELFATNVITDSNQFDGLSITSINRSPQRLFFYNLWSSMNRGIGIHLNGTSSHPIQDVYIYGVSRFNSVGVQSNYANAYMVLVLNNNTTQTKISNSNIIIKGLNTENSGLATIPAGVTSVTVNHGLICAPTKVLVTPLAQPPSPIWVSDITNTSFKINVSSPPTADLPVAWYAEC